jgi:hypothetical protein
LTPAKEEAREPPSSWTGVSNGLPDPTLLALTAGPLFVSIIVEDLYFKDILTFVKDKDILLFPP